MKRYIRIIAFFALILMVQSLNAQPKARRLKEAREKANAPTLSVRAKTQFVGEVTMPTELIWKRDIYRILDLKKEKNSPLYYPVEPMGKRTNLFTGLFRLLLEKKITAYEYRLDGNERFTTENKLDVKEFMDRFQIYYEQKAISKVDTVFSVNNSDIPSTEVLSFFVKESYYFDQRTSTYCTKVVALCPVMHRSDLFSSKTVKSPMFWVKYADISPYLTRMPIMASNYNNTSNYTVYDYFAVRLYQGDIYKTNNLLGQTLKQYCPTDSAIVKEQKKIESELTTFGQKLWEAETVETKTAQDSTAVQEEVASKVEKKRSSKRKGRLKSKSTKKKTTKKESLSTKNKSTTQSAPRMSVRRRRR